jgi:DNA-binding transcriptional ArsR family regulator
MQHRVPAIKPKLTDSPTRAFDLLWIALGHRARRAILVTLANHGPLSPCTLLEVFAGASRTTVSKQLRVMVQAGLVIVERHPLQRRKLVYRIAPGSLAALRDWLATVNDRDYLP